MPVHKYRSAAEVPRPPRATGNELVARWRALWDQAFALAQPTVVRGVQRFASIEAAQAARAQQVCERMRRAGARTGEGAESAGE